MDNKDQYMKKETQTEEDNTDFHSLETRVEVDNTNCHSPQTRTIADSFSFASVTASVAALAITSANANAQWYFLNFLAPFSNSIFRNYKLTDQVLAEEEDPSESGEACKVMDNKYKGSALDLLQSRWLKPLPEGFNADSCPHRCHGVFEAWPKHRHDLPP